MTPELYNTVKNTGAALLILLLLSGTVSGCKQLECDNGPSGALRTLAGTDATIALKASPDNCTYTLTINKPDPYLRWKKDTDKFGSHSITCFMDYWDDHYGDDEQPAVVWIGTTDPVCATISSLKYSAGVITGVLRRRLSTDPGLAGSGDIAIDINNFCDFLGPCSGIKDLTSNCYQPFFSPEDTSFIANASGASLNFSSFAGVWMPDSDMSGTALSYASFQGATLTEVDFHDAVMVYTDFTGADMTGAQAYGARVYKTKAPNGVEVNNYQDLLLNQVGYIPTTISSTSTSTNSTTSTTTIGTTTTSS